MNMTKLILNPVRLRILQYILSKGEATAREVCEAIIDIPRATIYRHTKLLEENKLLVIVKENRVRGTVEKVYSVDRQKLTSDNNTTSHLANAYFINLMEEMQIYLQQVDADIKKDMIFFNTSILNVSDDEYTEMLQKISDILKEYMKLNPSPNRKARKLSMISSFQNKK